MEQCNYKRKSDGIYIINMKRTWEKLLLTAVAHRFSIENPADVSIISKNTDPQGSCAEVRGCHRSHSHRWLLHRWNLS
jgi:ribosomal protein S2